MKRLAESKAEEWARSRYASEPLVITGIKGVGKTYLACEFISSFFQSYLYFNFENDVILRNLFTEIPSSDDENFLSVLSRFVTSEAIPEEMLIILDEIYLCDKAMSLLSAYIEKKNDKRKLIIISSGKLSLPIEKICLLKMFPMTFEEYLLATGREWYRDIIRGHFSEHRRLPSMVHSELLDIFDEYMSVGGMPESILARENSYNLPEIIRKEYLNAYSVIPGICADETDRLRASQIMSAVPDMLENRKRFNFSAIRKGLSYKDFYTAIEALTACGLLIRCDRLSADNDSDQPLFRLFPSEQSFLDTMCSDLSVSLTTKLKAYISLEIEAQNRQAHYWQSEGSALIDFVIERNDSIEKEYIPVAIRSGRAVGTKALEVFDSSFPYNEGYFISDSELCRKGKIITVPYYAVFCIPQR